MATTLPQQPVYLSLAPRWCHATVLDELDLYDEEEPGDAMTQFLDRIARVHAAAERITLPGVIVLLKGELTRPDGSKPLSEIVTASRLLEIQRLGRRYEEVFVRWDSAISPNASKEKKAQADALSRETDEAQEAWTAAMESLKIDLYGPVPIAFALHREYESLNGTARELSNPRTTPDRAKYLKGHRDELLALFASRAAADTTEPMELMLLEDDLYLVKGRNVYTYNTASEAIGMYAGVLSADGKTIVRYV